MFLWYSLCKMFNKQVYFQWVVFVVISCFDQIHGLHNVLSRPRHTEGQDNKITPA